MFARTVGIVGSVFLLGYMLMDVWNEDKAKPSSASSQSPQQTPPPEGETAAPSGNEGSSPSQEQVAAQDSQADVEGENIQPGTAVSIDTVTSTTDTTAYLPAQPSQASEQPVVKIDVPAVENVAENTETPSSEQVHSTTDEPPIAQEKPASAVADADETTAEIPEVAEPTDQAQSELEPVETATDVPNKKVVAAKPEQPSASKEIEVALMATYSSSTAVHTAPSQNSMITASVGKGTIFRVVPVANSSWVYVQDLQYSVSGYLPASKLSALGN